MILSRLDALLAKPIEENHLDLDKCQDISYSEYTLALRGSEDMPSVINRNQPLNPFDIRQGLAVSQECMSHLLKVSTRTVTRWEKGEGRPSDPDTLSRLAKLKEIKDLGLMVYTPEGLKEFLKTPLPVFGGRSAFDLLMLGDYEPVISALAADFEGTGF
jgi:DNA-binding transcriptional regulator YiaG